MSSQFARLKGALDRVGTTTPGTIVPVFAEDLHSILAHYVDVVRESAELKAKVERKDAALRVALEALKAIVESLADQDDEGLIEHAQQMIDARVAIKQIKDAL